MNTMKWLLFLILTLMGIFAVLFFANKNSPPFTSEKKVSKDEKVFKTYYDSGKIKTEVTYVNNKKHGNAYNYYTNGNIHTQFYYQNGLKEGEAIWFYENGRTYQRTTYVNNLKEGIQYRYYENGALLAEIPFKMDSLLIGTKEYFKNGEVITRYPEFSITPLNIKEKYIPLKIDGIASKKIKEVSAEILHIGGKRIIHGTKEGEKFFIKIPVELRNSAKEIFIHITIKTDLNNPKMLTKKFL